MLPSQDGVLPEESESNVMIKIVDDQGDTISYFPAKERGSIVDNAEEAGIEIPVSCQAGACFTCAARVQQGMEDIDIGKVSVQLIDTDEDQILCCIAGVKDECFTDGQKHEIVLHKYM